MTKGNNYSNVIPISKAKGRAPSKRAKLELAQSIVYDAWETRGKRRTVLAKQALAISDDCADAHILLAEPVKDLQQRIELYRKAVAAGSRALGKNWESKYDGVFWLELDTRPLMRAMARLAIDLQSEGELDEALSLYRKLMAINPNDNQGIRYLLVSCLYEARLDEELEKLLRDYRDDASAALLYTKALHLFRKHGATKRAGNALLVAFDANMHVPIFLSGVVEMPREAPGTIGFGDEREAVAYAMDYGHLWSGTEGSRAWMAEALGTDLGEVIEERDLADEVLRALKQATAK